MEFKNIQEKIVFLKKQEERVKLLKESQSKFSVWDSLLKHLAPAVVSFITFIILFDTIFALSFSLSFLISSIFLEYYWIKKSNLNKLMQEFPIKGVTSIDEYSEKLSAISFRAVADENHQVAKELLEHLAEEERCRVANKKKSPPLKIIESEE